MWTLNGPRSNPAGNGPPAPIRGGRTHSGRSAVPDCFVASLMSGRCQPAWLEIALVCLGCRRPRRRAPMASLSRVGSTAFMVSIAWACAPAA